jgi:exosome complex RNA-binding protein Csl4
MVHDLVGSGLKFNVVDLGQGWVERNPDDEDKQDARKQQERRSIVLSQADDFFAKNMFKDYGLLAQNTKRMLDDYKETVAQNKNISTIEDMTRIVENMPEFKKLANNALKHAAVVGEITRVMGDRHLIEISTLEQTLACSSDHAQHVERVKEKIRDPKIHVEDKLRLAMLYALRYETHGGNRIPEIKQLLRASRVTEDRVKLLDIILDYAGTARRTKEMLYGAGSDLFSGIVTMVKGVAQTSGVENVLTQHKPMLAKTLEEIRTGRLPESKYPSATSNASSGGMGSTSGYGGPSASPPPTANMVPPAKEVIVLILGGATFEEAAYVATLNNVPAIGTNPPFKVLLGGTSILNSRSFLSELGSLTM